MTSLTIGKGMARSLWELWGGGRKEAGWRPGGSIEQEIGQLSTRVLVPSLTVELGKTSWFPLPPHQQESSLLGLHTHDAVRVI